jgi:hypothetical protein
LANSKPPLNQTKPGQLKSTKASQGAHSQFKPQEQSQGTVQEPAPSSKNAADPNGNQFGVLNDLLKLAQKPENTRQNPTSNRKLLSFLQQKMLLEQKNQPEPVRYEQINEKDKIEKEIQSDLNYLNVFVAPIGSINIFT